MLSVFPQVCWLAPLTSCWTPAPVWPRTGFSTRPLIPWFTGPSPTVTYCFSSASHSGIFSHIPPAPWWPLAAGALPHALLEINAHFSFKHCCSSERDVRLTVSAFKVQFRFKPSIQESMLQFVRNWYLCRATKSLLMQDSMVNVQLRTLMLRERLWLC